MPRLPLLAAILVALTPAASHAQKEFGFDNRKSSGQPYLSPAETVARMTVPPEFEVKLFAGEPQVVNPVAFSIDERGRVWVLECFEYPSRTPKGKSPRDRIVILEDTDGDGACDTRTVFAEGSLFPVTPERQKAGLPAFDLATGLEVGHGKVYVGAPPYLWTIDITGPNADKPGKIEPVLSGFGSQDTHETLNTFQWGPDGWLYGMQGIFTQSKIKAAGAESETKMDAAVWRYHPVTKKFETYAEGTSNPWGIDWRNTDGEFILACCVIPHLYHVVPGGVYKRQAGSSANPYAYGYLNEISDHTFHKESGWAHAGLISLDAPHIPARFQNSVIFGSIHGTSLKQNILKPHGSSYTASRGDDFLTSADKNVRPINLKWGPNGDIYLIDWHDQNPCHQAAADSWDSERGRVYRIQLKGRAAKKLPDFARLRQSGFTIGAVDPTPSDPWAKRTALRLDFERAARNVQQSFDFGPYSGTDLMTVYGHCAAGRFTPNTGSLAEKFTKTSPEVRVFQMRTLADYTGKEPEKVVAFLANEAKTDDSPAVRREIAAACVKLGGKHDVSPVLRALMAHADDAGDAMIPHFTWLAYEKVIARQPKPDQSVRPAAEELKWLAEQSPANIFVRDQIVPKVMRRLAATGKADDLALCVQFVADSKDLFTREKALDGLATALDRRTAAAPPAWAALSAELLATNDPRLTGPANRLAVSFRDPKLAAAALATASDGAASAEARAEAVRRIAALKPDGAAELLGKLVGQSGPDAVRVEAARGLASVGTAAVAQQLVAEWKRLPAAVRAELVPVFAGRKDWAKTLLAAMKAGTVDRAAVTDNTVIKMQAFRDAELNALIDIAWGKSRNSPAEMVAMIDAMRGELGKGSANFARGRLAFEANCAKCHQFEGRGQSVGPALDGAARDIEYILANVIDPNRVVGAPYFVRVANTLDGKVEQGILHEEDAQSITLKIENGVLRRIPKDDLDGPVKVVEKSIMPEGLASAMGPEAFRDLVHYLMASPYLVRGKLNGKPLAAPATGLVRLPAGEAAVLEFEFTAAKPLSTQLVLGASRDYAVELDGKPLATGKATALSSEPRSHPATLAAGKHKLTLRLPAGGDGVLSARVLDPERVLGYGE